MITLDGQGVLYQQLARAVRNAILSGRLGSGQKLPATRALAEQLSVSRNTVLAAFEQLLSEGYVESSAGSGTYVADNLPELIATDELAERPTQSTALAQTPLSKQAERLAEITPLASRLTWRLEQQTTDCDFRYGAPNFEGLPIKSWARTFARRMRAADAAQLSYGEPNGSSELREALAMYLGRSRGVHCDAEQIIITHGTQQAINLVADVLLNEGDRVALEEPCYPGFTLPLLARNVEAVAVPTDSDGLQVAALAEHNKLRLVCVTPSHQFPGGGLMPLSRRMQLLEFSQQSNVCILEDDYDSEFRYNGRPVQSLQGIDTAGRVIYVGSASKLLFPALRIGWLVTPKTLLDAFRRAKAVADTGTATVEQLALADFVNDGELERHIRRMRVQNAQRREALLRAIDQHFGANATVEGADAGVHIVLWLPQLPPQKFPALQAYCHQAGASVYSVEDYFAQKPKCVGLLMGYTSPCPEAISNGIAVLAAAVREMGGMS